jgi:small subunit ribosomal protein S18
MKNTQQDFYDANQIKFIDFKDIEILKKFINPNGRIISKNRSGLTAKHQREVAAAIKRARFMGLLPYIAR